jgi:protein-S-isoprenylcysteine O-methyltransferase Ste14
MRAVELVFALGWAAFCSGILAAGLGTTVALSWTWLTSVGLAGVYFLYSAMVEERYMTDHFPDGYPAYKRSTKMLVPFIL